MNYILILFIILFVVGLFSDNNNKNTNNSFGYDDCDDDTFDNCDIDDD